LAREQWVELDPNGAQAARALNRKKWASPVVVEMTVIVKVPVVEVVVVVVVVEMTVIVKVPVVEVVAAVAEAALARKKWTSPEMAVDAMGIMMPVLAPLVETAAAVARMQWRALPETEEVCVMMAPAVEAAAAGALARKQ
jgi:hypothetical protein